MRLCREALAAADAYLSDAHGAVARRVVVDGRPDATRLRDAQFAAHGLAWIATTVEALRQLHRWAEGLHAAGTLGELDALILAAGFGEYLCQLQGGIAMSQGEIVRPADLGLGEAARTRLADAAVSRLMAEGNTSASRNRIAAHMAERFGNAGLDDTLELVRAQFRRFADEEIAPHAGRWHAEDALIPLDLMGRMAELGVFALTVPKEDGGLGMGRLAMCVVTEELSRAHLGAGSLATRSEIAAELIRLAGTEAQRRRYLPGIAAGKIIPAAVFSEPEAGSDLAAVRTRAVRVDENYKVTGAKTWATHAARADLMVLLVRTDPEAKGHRGLSLLLADKPRGSEDNPFPAPGMRGGEIGVLGYRGMREYEIAFEEFEVPAAALLGAVEGAGFKQLMAGMEAGRIQTAARAVGVAQSALELALGYATERVQFGKPILRFERIAGKLAWMAVETMIARQLTYFAARAKDGGRRADIEAGMAKLLAARVAWANADNAVQVHGGNGYAVEYAVSRVLLNARILAIFEGTAEILAEVIARGLLSRSG